jgi:hypothetical protein
MTHHPTERLYLKFAELQPRPTPAPASAEALLLSLISADIPSSRFRLGFAVVRGARWPPPRANMNTHSSRYRTIAALLPLCCLGWPSPSLAQAPALDGLCNFDSREDLRLPDYIGSMPDAPRVSRVPRLRLFRIAPGFLADPVGMQDDDIGLPGVPSMGANPNLMAVESDDGPDWLQIGMGADNPFFELRRPGDPGGVGYYRVNTQVALLDSPTTACTVGVQAWTPAGAQFAGLPTGPTVLRPAFSVFHAVNERLALQGFVSDNVPLALADDSSNDRLAFASFTSRTRLLGNGDGFGSLQRHLQYGVALQRPLLAEGPDGWRNLFFTVGALGQLNAQRDSLRLVPNYDVLPGLQWHLNENWWVSSAVLLPLGPTRAAPGQWQLTCSLQF